MIKRMIQFLGAALMGTLIVLAQSPANPREVRIAVAADLKWALEEARQVFEKANPGVTCTLTFGSSGNFYNQLAQKAPFDLFLSADLGYPRKLADQGLGLRETLFTYAIGHVVVWVPKASPIPVESLGIKAVQHPSVRKIAIANPAFRRLVQLRDRELEGVAFDELLDRSDRLKFLTELMRLMGGEVPEFRHRLAYRRGSGGTVTAETVISLVLGQNKAIDHLTIVTTEDHPVDG